MRALSGEESNAFALGEVAFYVVLLVAGMMFVLSGRNDKRADGRGDGTGKLITGTVLLSVFALVVLVQVAISAAPEDPSATAAQRSADREIAEQDDIIAQISTARQFVVGDPELRVRSRQVDGTVEDLRYAVGGATGTFAVSGQLGNLRFVDEKIFYRPSTGLWKKIAATPQDAESIIQAADGRWLDLDTDGSFYRMFSPVADAKWLLEQMPVDARWRSSAPDVVRGRKCLVLRGDLGATLYLESGTLRPVRIIAGDKTVTDVWLEAKAPPPRAPDDAVDSAEILSEEDAA